MICRGSGVMICRGPSGKGRGEFEECREGAREDGGDEGGRDEDSGDGGGSPIGLRATVGAHSSARFFNLRLPAIKFFLGNNFENFSSACK